MHVNKASQDSRKRRHSRYSERWLAAHGRLFGAVKYRPAIRACGKIRRLGLHNSVVGAADSTVLSQRGADHAAALLELAEDDGTIRSIRAPASAIAVQ